MQVETFVLKFTNPFHSMHKLDGFTNLYMKSKMIISVNPLYGKGFRRRFWAYLR